MTPARILVVEDNRVVSRDIQHQLERIGHTVVGATARGDDAVTLVLATRPDLVVMDIRLEGAVDGVEAAQRVREQCHVPVVFLTAYADDETVQRARLTEPFGYLLKPFEDSQLRTAIDMALYKHEAERKLRESERRFVSTLSSIGDAVIATDDKGRVTFMNPVAESLTGWIQADGLGQLLSTVFRIVNEETRQPVEDPAAKVLRVGATVGLANHTVLLARDGRELPIDDSGSPIIDDRGRITGTVLVFRDVTQRRHAEEALRRAQADLIHVARLTTMGELVASIAHEVNQPLAAIVTNAEACLRWSAHDPPDIERVRRSIELIARDGQQAGDVIRSIRAMLRKSAPQFVRLDVNDMIQDVRELMRGELRRHDVALDATLCAGDRTVMGDRVQLQQVLVNLVMNGIEAMSGITQRPRVLEVSIARNPDRSVLIAVADTGTGIHSAEQARIFEPFFTTKRDGMGMGLSICRAIVEAHGGRLWASPRLPCGSIFQFTLPPSVEH